MPLNRIMHGISHCIRRLQLGLKRKCLFLFFFAKRNFVTFDEISRSFVYEKFVSTAILAKTPSTFRKENLGENNFYSSFCLTHVLAKLFRNFAIQFFFSHKSAINIMSSRYFYKNVSLFHILLLLL
jgi:hypothetical protein